jgi:flavin-binding protein dodecin
LRRGEIGEENAMAMLKVIEVLAESTKSWEDATQQAIADASKTVRNVKSIYVENFEATVDNGQIKAYRINAKISFVLE